MEEAGGAADDVRAGDEMVGYYVFNASQAPNHSSDTLGAYYVSNVPNQFELYASVGKLHIASFDHQIREFDSEMFVHNNDAAPGYPPEDAYEVFCWEAKVTDAFGVEAGFFFQLRTDSNLDALSSTALPLLPPPLDKFQINSITLNIGGQGYVGGRLTSLTRSL